MEPKSKIWVAVMKDGERFVFYKEPPEGILKWAQGVECTVYEGELTKVIYRKVGP